MKKHAKSQRWQVAIYAARFAFLLAIISGILHTLGLQIWAMAAFFSGFFILIALLAALGCMRAVDWITWVFYVVLMRGKE